jgi:peptide/nickel transport system ATP-binding protein
VSPRAAEPARAAEPGEAPEQDILTVRDLSVEYLLDSGPVLAVDQVSFSLARGEFLAIVGESGCGKSTLLFGIAQLLSAPAEIIGGSVLFRGQDMVGLTDSALRAMNALNPVKSIGAQFKDAMRAHGVTSREEIESRSAQVLRMVGIDPVHLHSYPHQLSGGMRQRAMIAMAMLFTPQLVIMDEPTSALDVVAQRSLMVQISELREQFGFAVVFVTHDMSLVSHFSDHLMVMYAGQIAEVGPTARLFDKPAHPYTAGLMEAFPSIRGARKPLKGIPGNPPNLAMPPLGCRFAPRCPHVMERCTTAPPALRQIDGVRVRCYLYDDVTAHVSGASQ